MPKVTVAYFLEKLLETLKSLNAIPNIRLLSTKNLLISIDIVSQTAKHYSK